jgi:glc operon protein GlcG
MFTKPALSSGDAKMIAAAAIAEAECRNLRVTIAIVDDGGHLLYLERMDGARLATVEGAIAKARTSALFRRPTKNYEEALAVGNLVSLGMPNITPAEGGVPLYHGGFGVGAIAVSGAPQVDDGEIAAVGAATLASLDN